VPYLERAGEVKLVAQYLVSAWVHKPRIREAQLGTYQLPTGLASLTNLVNKLDHPIHLPIKHIHEHTATMSGKAYALVLLPKLTGGISMTFSSMILYTVVKKIRRNQSHVYDRLVLGMSIADLLGSFWMFMSTWPIPENSGMLWAVGNQATCNLQGFFTQGATVASAIYNASLTFYFLSMALFQWKHPQLRRYEWSFYIVPIVWGLCTATAAIPLKLYNNANLWCWISEAEGDRGENAHFFRMLFFYGPLYMLICVVTINVVLIIWYVQKVTSTVIQNQKHLSSNSKSNTDDRMTSEFQDSVDYDEDEDEEFLNPDSAQSSIASTGTNNSPWKPSNSLEPDVTTSKENRWARWQTKVAYQNLRFAMAFYYTWLPISVSLLRIEFDCCQGM
jgi:Slime mold cyclic AMP receptor